jgi:hypothetical protein
LNHADLDDLKVIADLNTPKHDLDLSHIPNKDYLSISELVNGDIELTLNAPLYDLE